MPRHTRQAPAKVNLTLRVLGKRDDGFHELESLMAPIDLADELEFEKADAFSLTCDDAGVPVDESNLVSKAVRVFEREWGRPVRWSIDLKKRVPHGAGLGGGSSDAATTLLALNELEAAGLSDAKLSAMAAEIGSDIPFFIYQQACMIRGRGERVEPVAMPGLKGVSILLLKPSFGVSTPDAYRNCLGAKGLDGIEYGPQKLPWGKIVNDLERPVFYKHRFLAEMKSWLLEQAEVDAAMMSGSGSTMMAFLECEHAVKVVERAREELDPTLWAESVSIV